MDDERIVQFLELAGVVSTGLSTVYCQFITRMNHFHQSSDDFLSPLLPRRVCCSGPAGWTWRWTGTGETLGTVECGVDKKWEESEL